MAELPKDIPLTPVMYLDMARGGWSHSYRNDELGLNVVKRAETRHADVEVDIWFDYFPNYCWHTASAFRSMVVDVG